MAKFGIIISDEKVFSGDIIELDFNRSSFTPDETPEAISHEFSIDQTNWINVTQQRKIVWSFNSVGLKTVYLRLTSTSGSEVFSKSINVLDLAAQKLFSKDQDLANVEPEIMKMLPKKWSSWNLMHLAAQEKIINLIREKGWKSWSGVAYTKDDFLNVSEVKEWSIAIALELAYFNISNASNDVFMEKSKYYASLVNAREANARIKLDYNKNTVADKDEEATFNTVGLSRA